MISVLSLHHKTHLRLLLLLSCMLSLTAGFSQTAEAAMTAEALYTDLATVQEAIEDDDRDLAEKLLRNILLTEENNPLVHRLLGSVLLKSGLIDAAIDEFTTSLRQDPQDELTKEYLFSIYYNRAQDLLEIPLEAYKARGELEKAIALRPDGIMSYYFLGSLNYQEQRYAECITTLLKVKDTLPEALRPNLHVMFYNSAFNLLNRKRAHDAKDVLPYILTRPQSTINELLLFATIALEIDDFAKSIELYDRILSKDPLHAVALHNRGFAQERLDEIRQREAAVSLQKPNPESPPAESLSKPPATSVTSAP